MKDLILASKSPRRKELLERVSRNFACIPADIDETIDTENDLKEEIMNLARRKAEAVLKDHEDAIVIGSDTIVVLNGKVMGKPHREEEAVSMLESLSGNTHQVITGLAILSSQREYRNVSVSDVTFASLSKEEILAYVSSGEPMDKAGAYGIQGMGGRFITRIDGDHYAIMGLPLNLVYEELKNADRY